MKYWDWEFFQTAITSNRYSVSDYGPLHGPITDFKLYRDDSLNLVLETTSPFNSTSNAIERLVGEVYEIDDRIVLEGRTGDRVVATGVAPLEHTKKLGTRAECSVTQERSSIESLEWIVHNGPQPQHVIEWIGNIGAFMWPDFDHRIQDGHERRILKSPKRKVVFSGPIKAEQHSLSCAYIEAAGIELIVGKSKATPQYVEQPGFILYLGTPDENVREKIRSCLSFCLGTYLIYFGDTKFDSNWRPVALTAKSVHALAKDAPDLNGWQPSPLHPKWDRAIDAEILGRMVSALYEIYDTYDLRSALWNYWHAVAAPLHMRAAHFGAAIESLQSMYFKTTAKLHRYIVEDDDHWTNLHKQIAACINTAGLPDEARRLLLNKANGLNFAPQPILMERFAAALNLDIGKLEKSAWANRNRSAHGIRLGEANITTTIRENNVLQTLMNRLLLALGGGTDRYYDYYTLGRPKRHIRHSIPVDRSG
ncbi:hypothetical protein G5B35_01975 [Parapusillimonas sp. SGNA-6]|nr:hypothetical protein [Parapusillimonas sp. SGNA-6]